VQSPLFQQNERILVGRFLLLHTSPLWGGMEFVAAFERDMRAPCRDACARDIRRVGKGAFGAVPTIPCSVGNENVAHPTAPHSRGLARRKTQSSMVSRFWRNRAGAFRRATCAQVTT
jgi:hypothetical protein